MSVGFALAAITSGVTGGTGESDGVHIVRGRVAGVEASAILQKSCPAVTA